MKTFFSIIFLLYAWQGFASQFIPLELNLQLSESDAVLYGVFQGSHVQKISDGSIVTVNSFRIKEIAGVPETAIYNHNQFDIYTPGGLWQGKRVTVSGVPHFIKNEECVLLLKQGKWGWTVQNFALGKYKVLFDGNNKFLQSVIFPHHRLLGKIPFDYFHSMVGQYMSSELRAPFVKENVIVRNDINGSNIRNRKPASVMSSEKADTEDGETMSLIWLAIILALFGSFMTWIHSFAYDED